MERMVDFMLKAINIKWDTDGDMEVLNELPDVYKRQHLMMTKKNGGKGK